MHTVIKKAINNFQAFFLLSEVGFPKLKEEYSTSWIS